jgi:hypothetical protein
METLKSKLEKINKRKSRPILLSIRNLVYSRFENIIHALNIIKLNFELNLKIIEKKFEGNANFSKIDVLEKYFFNANMIAKSTTFYHDQFKNGKNKNLTKSVYWFIDSDQTNLNDLKNQKNILKDLYALYYTLPIIRALNEVDNNQDKIFYDELFYANEETELFASNNLLTNSRLRTMKDKNDYNFNKNDYEHQNIFKELQNEENCLNKKGINPKTFYFPCRDWFKTIKKEFTKEYNKKNITDKVTISNPYKSLGSEGYRNSVCIEFLKNYSDKKFQNLNPNLSIICFDIDFSAIKEILDEFNQQLNGYFFIMKIDSAIPIYHPYFTNDLIFSDLQSLEFNLNEKYYFNEIDYFNSKILKNFTKEIEFEQYDKTINDKDNDNFLTGVFYKNNEEIKYQIMPIFFNCDAKQNKLTHQFSIVYVYKDNIGENAISIYNLLNSPLKLLEIFLYIFLLFISFKVCWNFLREIGFNITRPIKNLKIQMREINADSNNNTNYNTHINEAKELDDNTNIANSEAFNNKNIGEKQKNKNGKNHPKEKNIQNKFNENSISDKKQIQKQKIIGKNNNGYFDLNQEDFSDDSVSQELEEDDMGMVSEEMSKIFDTIMNLKNVMSFTSKKNNKHDSIALIKYINSINTFKKINNPDAEKISESNLGAMLITFRKFNYAILHLNKSIIDDEKMKINQSNNKENLPEIYKKVLQKLKRMFEMKKPNENDKNKPNENDKKKPINLNKFKGFVKKFKRSTTINYTNKNKFDKDNKENEDSRNNNNNQILNFNKNPYKNENEENNNTDQINIIKSKNLFEEEIKYEDENESKKANKNEKENENNTNQHNNIEILIQRENKMNLNKRKLTLDLNSNSNHLNEYNDSLFNSNISKGKLMRADSFKVKKRNSKGNFQNNNNDNNDNVNIIKNIYKENDNNNDNNDKILHENILKYKENITEKNLISCMTEENKVKSIKKKKEKKGNFNVNSRYPKLMYSFKTYFKSIRFLSKNKNFEAEKFNNDISITFKDIDLKLYEFYLLQYIEESIDNGNYKRIGESILEYIEFIIVYKIKNLESRENNNKSYNCKNDNYNPYSKNEEESENFLFNSEEKINLNPINQNYDNILSEIKSFFGFFNAIKTKFSSKMKIEYMKNYMDIMTEKRINDLDLIENPIFILIMKSYYLQGKLAKICGHYDKALEYFYKSRECLAICDAHLIKKSNKNIIKIYEILINKLNEEQEKSKNNSNIDLKSNKKRKNSNININSPNNDNQRFSKDNWSNFIQQKLDYLRNIEELKTNIKNINEEMNNFNDKYKDILVLIDINNINIIDNKKYENLIKLVNGLFDNYVCIGDRFGLCYFNNVITTVLPLEKKQISNSIFVKNNFNNAVKCLNNLINEEINNNYNENLNLNLKSNVCKNIMSAFDYLNNKWSNINEKFILIFAFNYDKNIESDYKKQFEKYEIFKKSINLIFVGIDFEESSRLDALDLISYFSDKSAFINYNDIGILNNIFKKKVLKSDELYFPIEVYKSQNSHYFDKY